MTLKCVCLKVTEVVSYFEMCVYLKVTEVMSDFEMCVCLKTCTYVKKHI